MGYLRWSELDLREGRSCPSGLCYPPGCLPDPCQVCGLGALRAGGGARGLVTVALTLSGPRGCLSRMEAAQPATHAQRPRLQALALLTPLPSLPACPLPSPRFWS